MTQILLKGIDGSVAIMTLVDGADVEETIRKFKDSHPDGFYVDYFEFDGKLPENREFRDAWTHDGKQIVVHQGKAKNIHLGRIRAVRNAELDKLDKEQMRNLSNSAKLQELEDKKQILRDLPANVKGLEWPDNLPR